ncbi:sensor histidine kinase [Mucilaginibacter lacusdianchii]|uniref:sensor histidine kinase n=1 Tax=Mucilaginibacter lacusdianchii TaxID=2684211 RepID=UPI00131B7B19|nr:HAMP domain-containing sensor histidine kinase [Mucilaginibacter sp. JXJ CY 39]
MTIQRKITLLFVCITAGILLLLNAFILYFDYRFAYEDFFKRLEARVNLTAQTRLFPGERSRAYQEVRTKYLEKLEEENEQIIRADAQGRFNTTGLPQEFYQDLFANGRARFKMGNKFFAGKVVNAAGQDYLVIVTALNPYGFSELQELQRLMLFGLVGSLIVVFFVGKVFSYYTFMPVRKLTEKVKSITSNNLHMRLDDPKGKDEIAELTYTFNNMLTRLETAFETQTNFVSNASHELRTPLTVINSEVELALHKDNLRDETRQVLSTISAEADKLTQILNSLLTLAQSGYDGKKQNWQPVRVDELIWQAIESVKKIQPDSNIQVDFAALPDDETQLITFGNNNLLCLALTNLINNACKYSQNQLVNVKLFIQHKTIITAITDHGIGIPSTELQHIFEPFFRASNTYNYVGHGVGLPLTLNIIRLHSGTINIRSEENTGTEIQVSLPMGQS